MSKLSSKRNKKRKSGDLPDDVLAEPATKSSCQESGADSKDVSTSTSGNKRSSPTETPTAAEKSPSGSSAPLGTPDTTGGRSPAQASNVQLENEV